MDDTSSEQITEGNMEELHLQFIEEASLELEANFEINTEVAKTGVLAKILGSRPLSKGRVKQILTGVWTLKGKWRMKTLEKGTWGFFFDKLEDKEEVLNRRPWIIAGQLLNIREWPLDGNWYGVPMNKSVFWVEIHGFPTPYLAFQNSSVIGAKVGEFLESDGVDNCTITRRGLGGYSDRPTSPGRVLPEERAYAFPPIGKAVPLYGPWIKVNVPIQNCFDTGPALLQDGNNRTANIQGTSQVQAVGEGPSELHGTGVNVAATTTNAAGDCTIGTKDTEPTFINGPANTLEEITAKLSGPMWDGERVQMILVLNGSTL
ncbi:hypothetical protein G4B88_026950 [Cannabis sativa]|uniref:DUF4283 domain-containing protein n=1 Tax=Cannabis sativa TaxID=3483 RepID=A0A7J6EGU3_CANSA|nr:hypothetical protein G4B88_026950 [Cannabis sativa]